MVNSFNNIAVISLWSVLLGEETGIPGENHQPAAMEVNMIFIFLCGLSI
jgi:hypothetical protein